MYKYKSDVFHACHKDVISMGLLVMLCNKSHFGLTKCSLGNKRIPSTELQFGWNLAAAKSANIQLLPCFQPVNSLLASYWKRGLHFWGTSTAHRECWSRKGQLKTSHCLFGNKHNCGAAWSAGSSSTCSWSLSHYLSSSIHTHSQPGEAPQAGSSKRAIFETTSINLSYVINLHWAYHLNGEKSTCFALTLYWATSERACSCVRIHSLIPFYGPNPASRWTHWCQWDLHGCNSEQDLAPYFGTMEFQ